ncbi:MAG: tetratricopeptide repeat protein [Anaerolineae bacterium]|nr:tetratricopeptide repeat protein [Anaerolineae bacterium]
MLDTFSFGEWVSRRRKAYDMTQRDLAEQSACGLVMIKKIETDERRPSRELAALLSEALRIPLEWRERFIECARGIRPLDALMGLTNDQLHSTSTTVPSTLRFSLPTQPTPFIGRQAELSQIVHHLADPNCRLLTLVGSGGIGKTRLAVQATRALVDIFSDGAVFVSLATLTDAALIPGAIAQSLRLTLSGSVEAQLISYLRTKSMLLVLDNCEQFGDGITWLSEVLASTTALKLLVTSRERLQLAEEWLYVVPEMDARQAAELFERTARRTLPTFDGTSQQAAIDAICTLVMHLPLAIELAASWTPYLSCEQIAEHIRHDIDFLAATVRNVPERHRSVRAVFDHSWKLLSTAEQIVLMKLSVFRGGWTADESALIAGTTLPMMRTLVEKSLVRVTDQGRYDLHELTRQYAADKLHSAGLTPEIRQRHCAVYQQLAERFGAQIGRAEAVAAFARLDQEHDNLRTAMSFALEIGAINVARHMVHSLFYFWQRRGYWQESERWILASFQAAEEADSVPLCQVLVCGAVCYGIQARYTESFGFLQRALDMARRLGDPTTLTEALTCLLQATPLAEADVVFEELMSIWTEMGDGWQVEHLANLHYLFGDRLRTIGRNEEAALHFHKSLRLFRELGNVDKIAYPLGNLGRMALQDGRLADAYPLIAESVALSRAIGNRVGIADWLQQLGAVVFALGDLEQAETYFEEALTLYDEIGNPSGHVSILAWQGHLALARGEISTSMRNFHAFLEVYMTMHRHQTAIILKRGPYIPPEVLHCLDGVIIAQAARDRAEQAVTLFGCVSELYAHTSISRNAQTQAHVEQAISTARARLTNADVERALTSGRAMSVDDVLAYALKLE